MTKEPLKEIDPDAPFVKEAWREAVGSWNTLIRDYNERLKTADEKYCEMIDSELRSQPNERNGEAQCRACEIEEMGSGTTPMSGPQPPQGDGAKCPYRIADCPKDYPPKAAPWRKGPDTIIVCKHGDYEFQCKLCQESEHDDIRCPYKKHDVSNFVIKGKWKIYLCGCKCHSATTTDRDEKLVSLPPEKDTKSAFSIAKEEIISLLRNLTGPFDYALMPKRDYIIEKVEALTPDATA